jgi:hypothetical protein
MWVPMCKVLLCCFASLDHATPQGNYLAINLNAEIKFQNFIKEAKRVWLGLCVLSLLLSLRMWVPVCKVLLCCFASLVEVFSEGR